MKEKTHLLINTYDGASFYNSYSINKISVGLYVSVLNKHYELLQLEAFVNKIRLPILLISLFSSSGYLDYY